MQNLTAKQKLVTNAQIIKIFVFSGSLRSAICCGDGFELVRRTTIQALSIHTFLPAIRQMLTSCNMDSSYLEFLFRKNTVSLIRSQRMSPIKMVMAPFVEMMLFFAIQTTGNPSL